MYVYQGLVETNLRMRYAIRVGESDICISRAGLNQS